jgi:hypothetical protein
MEAPENEIEELVRRLLELGLLVEYGGRLVQPELRNQYRETLRANKNKRRGKSFSESADEGGW